MKMLQHLLKSPVSLGLIVFIVQVLQACSVFTPPKERPIIYDKINVFGQYREFTTLAITPERRLVIFRRGVPENKTKPLICAQPSSDVAENLASTSAILAKGGTGDKNAQAELNRTLSTVSKQLFLRTQGVQLFRDAMYFACQDYLNEAISKEEFNERYNKLIPSIIELIKKEIPYLPQEKLDITIVPTTPKEAKPADATPPPKTSQPAAPETATPVPKSQ
jgi:hypothetical protein